MPPAPAAPPPDPPAGPRVTARSSLLLGSGAALLAAASFAVNGPLSGLAYDRGMSTLGLVVWRGTFAALLLGVDPRARGRPWPAAALPLARPEVRPPPRRRGGHRGHAQPDGLRGVRADDGRARPHHLLHVPGDAGRDGMLFHGERPSVARLGSLVLAIAGMALVMTSQLDPAEGIRLDLVGLALAFFAAVCQVVYFTIGHAGFRSLPADQATLGVFLRLAADLRGRRAARRERRRGGRRSSATRRSWPSRSSLGTVGAAVPSVLVLTSIRRIGGVRAGIILMFEPVVGSRSPRGPRPVGRPGPGRRGRARHRRRRSSCRGRRSARAAR